MNPSETIVKRQCDSFGITLKEFFGTKEFDALTANTLVKEQ